MVEAVVRCPYCVSDSEFLRMMALADGAFVCALCGHMNDSERRIPVSLLEVCGDAVTRCAPPRLKSWSLFWRNSRPCLPLPTLVGRQRDERAIRFRLHVRNKLKNVTRKQIRAFSFIGRRNFQPAYLELWARVR